MDAQPDKTGTVLTVLLAHKDKIGMLPQDHVDAQLDQTGTEYHVSAASVEDNGITIKKPALAHQETGTDSHVFHAPPVNNGIHQLYLAHAQPIHTGMVLTVKPVLVEIDTGTTH